MRSKVESYLGFAARARSLSTGYNTCIFMMEKRKLKLLILTEDLSENSKEKMLRAAKQYEVPCRTYGKMDDLSHITGTEGKGIFGLADKNLADALVSEIDRQSLEEEVF